MSSRRDDCVLIFVLLIFFWGLCRLFQFNLAFLWFWFVPPFSLGFFTSMVYLTVAMDFKDPKEELPCLPLIAVYLYAMEFYGEYHLLAYVQQNYWFVLAVFVVYICLGLIWSVINLRLYLRRPEVSRRLKYLCKLSPMRIDSYTTINENDLKYENSEIGLSNDEMDHITNQALLFRSNNVIRIYTWIVYWPLSIVHSLTRDGVREFLDVIFGGILKQVYISIISDIMIDLRQDLKKERREQLREEQAMRDRKKAD